MTQLVSLLPSDGAHRYLSAGRSFHLDLNQSKDALQDSRRNVDRLHALGWNQNTLPNDEAALDAQLTLHDTISVPQPATNSLDQADSHRNHAYQD
jgi:hypothetical protein